MAYEMIVPKTIHNHKIEKMDGTVIDLHEIGVVSVDLIISAPPINYHREKIEGGFGSISQGYDLEGRTLIGKYELYATDYNDYEFLRNETFKLFSSGEPFYLIRDLEPGKRWKVEGLMDVPERIALDTGKFEVEFYSHSPFCETIGTTLDPFTFDSDLWQIGQGIPIGLSEDDYKTTSEGFIITNFGDVMINPNFQHMSDLVIKITNADSTFINPLTIKNTTTGDEIKITDTFTNKTVEVKGIDVFQSGANINKETNRGVITLSPGDNQFIIINAGSEKETSVSFRPKFW